MLNIGQIVHFKDGEGGCRPAIVAEVLPRQEGSQAPIKAAVFMPEATPLHHVNYGDEAGEWHFAGAACE